MKELLNWKTGRYLKFTSINFDVFLTIRVRCVMKSRLETSLKRQTLIPVPKKRQYDAETGQEGYPNWDAQLSHA
jgi:hypothetical protein